MRALWSSILRTTPTGAGPRDGVRGLLPFVAHVALPLEKRPLFDEQLGGNERRLHPGAGQQLDALAAVHATGDRAPDRDHVALDVGVDAARLPDDEGVVGHDPPLDAAVDAEGVLEAELALELRALVHEPVQLLGGESLDLQHPPSGRAAGAPPRRGGSAPSPSGPRGGARGAAPRGAPPHAPTSLVGPPPGPWKSDPPPDRGRAGRAHVPHRGRPWRGSRGPRAANA